jgi:hypothetical protein
MLKVVLAALALMLTSVVVRAEEIVLDCQARLVNGKRTFTFRLDIDDNGVTYIQDDGVRSYDSNANGHYFRKNQSEIVFGSELSDAVINRRTGRYSSTLRGSLHEVGTCEKAKADATDRKF